MAGYVHVYTGDGKGKTTAALGLALRAAGAGWRVFLAQFGKSVPSSEMSALARFSDLITIRQYGCECPITGGGPQTEGPRAASPRASGLPDIDSALAECREAMTSGDYALVILDEANLGPSLRLFSIQRLLDLIDTRSSEVELVITGRYAHPSVLQRADLVTEMREVKHYYRHGVSARTGIEK